MRIIATTLTLAMLAGAAGAINYDIVRQVSNDGPTNFVGTDYLPATDNDPNWSGWTPLQVGDTITKTDDFGNVVNVPAGPKVVEQPRSTVNSFLNNEINRLVPKYEYPHAVNPSSPASVQPAAPSSAPTTPTNYNIVRQVSNDGPTNFIGTQELSTDDSGTTWTPLQVGDTFQAVDDFGNPITITVGPKLVLQKRSTVNSWLTLSRKGGALRVMN